ncbi:MAG: hypothetical protein ACOCTG_01085 [Bacteroidota bacterium]
MDPYFPIVLATTVLFFVLAAILLVPIYRFLQREEEASRRWTPEEIARRAREEHDRPNGRPPDSVRKRRNGNGKSE